MQIVQWLQHYSTAIMMAVAVLFAGATYEAVMATYHAIMSWLSGN